MVTDSNKPLSIALEEIAQGKIVVADPAEGFEALETDVDAADEEE